MKNILGADGDYADPQAPSDSKKNIIIIISYNKLQSNSSNI